MFYVRAQSLIFLPLIFLGQGCRFGFQQGQDGFLEFPQGGGEGSLLLLRPGGGIDGRELGVGLVHPFAVGRGGGRGALLAPAAGLLFRLLFLDLVPGRNHSAGLLLAGDLDQGLAGHGRVAAALVPDLLGQAGEGEDGGN